MGTGTNRQTLCIMPSSPEKNFPSVPLFSWLEIETQGDCNRTCNTCLRQTYVDKKHPTHIGRFPISTKQGKGNQMPTETFHSIIDQAHALNFSGNINMQHFNEPLLDERLVDFAAYIKNKYKIPLRSRRPQMAIRCCTNMDLITEELARELDGIIDMFNIALYMPKKRQQEREQWLKSLFKISVLRFTKGVHVATHFGPTPNLKAQIQQNITKKCTQYNNSFIIAFDGTVLHCCDDYVGHFGLGNVNTTSLEDIWNSKQHRKLVYDLSKEGGRQQYNYCRLCPR